MVSLTAANSVGLFLSRDSLTNSGTTHLSVPCLCAFNPQNKAKNRVKFASLSIRIGGSGLGFMSVRERRKKEDSCFLCGGFVRRCRKSKGWESEGSTVIELEAEILEFMENSDKPGVFPNKKDLIDAGRIDLVEAILKQGGWLAMGWDMDDLDNKREAKEEEKEENFRVRGNSFIDVGANTDRRTGIEERNGAWNSEVSGFDVNASSLLASSSGRAQEAPVKDESGIEGILSRLERERNSSLGLNLREKWSSNGSLSNGSQNRSLTWSSMDAAVGNLQRSSEPVLSRSSSFCENKSLSGEDSLRNSFKPETWRTWSMRRAGVLDKEFEAAEISSHDLGGENKTDAQGDNVLQKKGGSGEPTSRRHGANPSCEDMNQTHIKGRLQHLQSELSSVLNLLRLHTDEDVWAKEKEDYPNDLEELSDAWEFQENEIMSAQNKLRSMRAKLAVLEGKMAMAIIDARRIVSEKQHRIEHARRALQLLRTVCVVWPNSASEVFLTGSFDGWLTQRKMEKSKTGVFSLWLKLYPGRYEIKFIVDGQWKVDPLRPIVNNNGYENNLLIIT